MGNTQRRDNSVNIFYASHWHKAAVSVSLVFSLLSLATMIYAIHAMNKQFDDVAMTMTMHEEMDHIFAHLSQMDSNLKLYKISGSKENLDRFDLADQRIDRALASMDASSSHDEYWRNWVWHMRSEINIFRHALYKALKDAPDNDPENTLNHNSDLADSLNIYAGLSASMAPLTSQDVNNTMSVQEQPLQWSALSLPALVNSLTNFENKRISSRQHQLDNIRAVIVISCFIAALSIMLLARITIDRLRRNVRALQVYQQQLHDRNIVLEKRVCERTHEITQAQKRAERERGRAELLLQDVSHRIGNALATVSAILGMQIRQSDNTQVKQGLASAQQRIQAIAATHRRLQLSEDNSKADVKKFFSTLINDIITNQFDKQAQYITIHTDIDDVQLPARDVTTLGIILCELITNAFKYAFPDNRTGTIDIRFKAIGENFYEMCVSDDGVGIQDFDTHKKGLGTLLIEQFCTQYGDRPCFEQIETGGTRVHFKIRIHDNEIMA